MARAYLHRQAKAARDLLAPFSPGGVLGLQREVAAMPERHPALSTALGASAKADLRRLLAAANRRQPHERDAFVSSVLARAAFPLGRVALAKVIVALREAGTVDEHLAAAALVDLDQPRSVLFEVTLRRVAGQAGSPAPAAERQPHPAHA